MKKFLLIIPFICGIAFINTVRAEEMCTPETCLTTRDDKIVGKCVYHYKPTTNDCDTVLIKHICKCTPGQATKCTINKGEKLHEYKCVQQKTTTYTVTCNGNNEIDIQNIQVDEQPGTECTPSNPNSAYAECQYIRHNGTDVMSCVAKKCKPNYHLWFYDNNGTGKNSMGVCRSKSQAENYCVTYCTDKFKDKNCTPILNGKRTTTTVKKGSFTMNDAFIGCEHETKKDETETQPDKTPEQNSFNSEVFCDAESHKCFSYSIFADIDLKLDKYFAKGSSSVWKNDEGKFNTARLASDSIAGVVLGTVGGVITSNIIKKNQIENGFEDLKCTIGGQTVATFGDEFSVGIR